MFTLKQCCVLCFFILLLNVNSLAQDDMPFSVYNKSKSSQKNHPNRDIELALGYIPQSDKKALKGIVSVHNFVFKRLGAYTSFEYDLQTNEFTNTFGGTLTVHKYLYLWGGMDLFSKNGLIQNSFNGPRKEIGIGIIPYRWSVLRFGWSDSVGISISAGVAIPF